MIYLQILFQPTQHEESLQKLFVFEITPRICLVVSKICKLTEILAFTLSIKLITL